VLSWDHAKTILVLFDVECIQPIAWPRAGSDQMSSLILEESDKDVIRALTRKYARGESWGADYIKGKGEGQIFLLHGEQSNSQNLIYTLTIARRAPWHRENLHSW
jgi:hypothetical protein